MGVLINPSKVTEQEIIQSIQSGNLTDFGQLYDRYLKNIFNFIYHKTFHKETAEDLTSKTFMKALENISKYDSSKASFATWLYQIARNTTIDHYRTKKINYNIEDAWDISSKDDIAKDTATKYSFDQLQKHLKTLKSAERDIIMMRLWQYLSYKEIAKALGKTEVNCKVIYSRTVKKLQAEVLILLLLTIIL